MAVCGSMERTRLNDTHGAQRGRRFHPHKGQCHPEEERRRIRNSEGASEAMRAAIVRMMPALRGPLVVATSLLLAIGLVLLVADRIFGTPRRDVELLALF